MFIALTLFISLLSQGAFAQSHAAANSAAWHSQGRSVVALPSVATLSTPSVFSNGAVDHVPFGLSVAQAARSQNGADPIGLLDGSPSNGTPHSMTFSASLGTVQMFSDPVGLGSTDFTAPAWFGDSLGAQFATHLELFPANKVAGAYSANILNAANHFAATGTVVRFVFAKQSRYPITVTLPINLELGDDPYWFGHQYGWISGGVNLRVPLSFIPTRYGKWSAGSSADMVYYGTTATEFMNSVQPQLPKVAAAITLDL